MTAAQTFVLVLMVIPVGLIISCVASSHLIRHRWSMWEDAEVVVAYAEDGLPIWREQIQERRCRVCNRLEARRVAL